MVCSKTENSPEVREEIQSKRNIQGISEIWFVATEFEYCARGRQNDLERVKLEVWHVAVQRGHATGSAWALSKRLVVAETSQKTARR